MAADSSWTRLAATRPQGLPRTAAVPNRHQGQPVPLRKGCARLGEQRLRWQRVTRGHLSRSVPMLLQTLLRGEEEGFGGFVFWNLRIPLRQRG